MADKLIISKKKDANSNQVWKPLMVPKDLYDQVDAIADQVGIRKGYLAIRLLEFAIERLEIVEGDK